MKRPAEESDCTHEDGVADDVGGGVHRVPAHLRQVDPRHQVAVTEKQVNITRQVFSWWQRCYMYIY